MNQFFVGSGAGGGGRGSDWGQGGGRGVSVGGKPKIRRQRSTEAEERVLMDIIYNGGESHQLSHLQP